jgi:hypothetical protein
MNAVDMYSLTDPIEGVQTIIDKWFRPSGEVMVLYREIMKRYNIIPEETLGIFYRGADKYTDGRHGQGLLSNDVHSSQVQDQIRTITNRLRETLNYNPEIKRVMVQTDQQQFLDYFHEQFDDIEWFEISETLKTTNQQGIHHIGSMDNARRFNAAQSFAAVVYILAECRSLIFNNSNCSRMITLYRGSMDNIIQYKDCNKGEQPVIS